MNAKDITFCMVDGVNSRCLACGFSDSVASNDSLVVEFKSRRMKNREWVVGRCLNCKEMNELSECLPPSPKSLT